MSPASYRAAPPRVAPTNLPAATGPGKSVRGGPAPGAVHLADMAGVLESVPVTRGSARGRGAAGRAGRRRARRGGRRAGAARRRRGRGAGPLGRHRTVDGFLKRLLRLAVGREVAVGERLLGVLDRLLRVGQRIGERSVLALLPAGRRRGRA